MSTEIINRAFVASELFTIDPGISNGGVVKYNYERYESWAMSKMSDFNDMCDFFRYQKEICKQPLVFLEKITSFSGDYSGDTEQEKKQYVGKTFQLNKLKDHYVEIKAALKSADMPFIEVMPAQWQKYINVHIKNEDYKIRKSRLKDLASNQFPGQNVVGWNSDAFLILSFAIKKLKYEPSWVIKKMKENNKPRKNLFK